MKKIPFLLLLLPTLALSQPIQRNYYTTNADPAISASGSSNVMAGIPQHLNPDRLTRFYNTILYSNRPVRVVVTTDQLTGGDGTGWPINALDELNRVLNKDGGLIPYGGSAGDLKYTENVNAWHFNSPDQPGIFLGTESYLNTTNGGVITYSRVAGGSESGISSTNVYADTFIQPYLAEPRGGTFLIQTNTSGGGWATCRTVSANAVGTNLLVTNISLALGYHSVRLVHSGVTATNRFKPAQLYNSTTNNLVMGMIAVNAGGQFAKFVTQCSNTVSAPFWRSLNPDLLIMQDFADADNCAAWPALEASWATNCPNMDVIICGEFFLPGGTYSSYNAGMKTNALLYQRGYFDSMAFCGNQTVYSDFTNRNIIWHPALHDDANHLEKGGIKTLNTMLWDAFLRPLFPPNNLPTTANGPATRNNSFVSATNSEAFRITEGGDTLTIKRKEANVMEVFFDIPLTSQASIEGGNGTMTHRAHGGPMYFSTAPFSAQFTMHANDTGVSVGSGSAPGAGNLSVQNTNLSAANVANFHFGDGRGLSNVVADTLDQVLRQGNTATGQRLTLLDSTGLIITHDFATNVHWVNAPEAHFREATNYAQLVATNRLSQFRGSFQLVYSNVVYEIGLSGSTNNPNLTLTVVP